MIDKWLGPELLSRPVAQKISVSLEKTQPFSYTYPKETYYFSTAYAGVATQEKLAFQIRVGVCQMKVYGKTRGKIILFLDGDPGTEFTETDTTDFYVSLLKVARRALRPGQPLPTAFTSFVVRPVRDLIKGRYVPHAQAVVVQAEDLATMVRFAFVKRLYKGRGAEPAIMTEPQDNSSISGEEQFKRRALEAGLLQEIKRADYKARGDRTPITVTGTPLSQEVIEERR